MPVQSVNEDFIVTFVFWTQPMTLTNAIVIQRYICRVLSQNALSAIFDIFKVRAPSYLSNDTLLIIYKGIFLKLWSKVLQIFLLFSLCFSSIDQHGYNAFCDETLQIMFAKQFKCMGKTNSVHCWMNKYYPSWFNAYSPLSYNAFLSMFYNWYVCHYL